MIQLQIRTKYVEQTVDAEQFGKFAVHEAIGSSHGHSVTHITTGLALPCVFYDRKIATGVAQRLSDVLGADDFDSYHSETYKTFAPHAVLICRAALLRDTSAHDESE